MTNAEIVKGIRCCMLIDNSCDECPYHQYGKICNIMLYNDVMKFFPPITSDDCNTCKYPNMRENCARTIDNPIVGVKLNLDGSWSAIRKKDK